MSIDSRKALLTTLEAQLKTRLITYLTGDRQGINAQIGMDAVPLFRRHLEQIGEVESISVFLYTRGGDTNVPWRLVNLIREYCKQLTVLVPFRAHSAGTLFCMGANSIVMGKMGELSSIDPSVANPFNPIDPQNPLARLPISVEDVNAYKDLAQRFAGKDKEKNKELPIEVFLSMAAKLDPLALGNVERTYNQIRKLAADLLRLHSADSADKIQTIVKVLTEELYSHSHLISRHEAKKIGLNVDAADKSLDAQLWQLYSDYADEMELDRGAFNPLQMLGTKPSLRVELKRAFIESSEKTDAFISQGTVARHAPGAIQLPPGVQLPPGLTAQVAFQIETEGWKVVR